MKQFNSDVGIIAIRLQIFKSQKLIISGCIIYSILNKFFQVRLPMINNNKVQDNCFDYTVYCNISQFNCFIIIGSFIC